MSYEGMGCGSVGGDMPAEAHEERVELAVDGLADDFLAGVAPRGLVGDAAAQLPGALDAPLDDPERLDLRLWRALGGFGIRFFDSRGESRPRPGRGSPSPCRGNRR